MKECISARKQKQTKRNGRAKITREEKRLDASKGLQSSNESNECMSAKQNQEVAKEEKRSKQFYNLSRQPEPPCPSASDMTCRGMDMPVHGNLEQRATPRKRMGCGAIFDVTIFWQHEAPR